MEIYIDRQVHPLDMQYEIQITLFIKKKWMNVYRPITKSL